MMRLYFPLEMRYAISIVEQYYLKVKKKWSKYFGENFDSKYDVSFWTSAWRNKKKYWMLQKFNEKCLIYNNLKYEYIHFFDI